MPNSLDDVELLSLNEGEFVFEQGQSPEHFFILRRGTVELIRHKNTLRTIDTANVPIGNTDLILDIHRTHGARAAEESEVFVTSLNLDEIYDWYLNNPVKHIEELRSLSSVLDQFNKDNKQRFDRYREIRDVFAPFLNPLRIIYQHEKEKLELSNLLKNLLSDHVQIMDQAGKSGSLSVDDLSVSDNVKETFTAGKEICSEGEPGEDLYLLLDGSLSVLKEGQLVSSIQKQGLLFGEMAALLDNKRKASVVAETDSTVAVLPVDSLGRLFESSPGIARKINRMLLKRFEKAYQLNEQLNRFFENLGTMYESERSAQEYQSELRDLVENLRNRGSNHPNTKAELDKLEDWVNSDVSKDLTLFEERLSQADMKRFKETID